MKTTRNILTIVMMIAAIVLMASSADATILTFEGKGTNGNIPDTFGDNIAAAQTGISVANGTTPNVDLTWSASGGTWQFYNDAEWTGAAQLDAYSVGDTFDILFTPDSGYSVQVDSFVFDDYAGWGTGNKFNWSLFKDNSAGAVIASGTGTTANGQDLTVNTGMATSYAGPVLLRVTEHPDDVAGRGDDQALDSISFTQTGTPPPPVPAPLDTNLVLNPGFEDVDPTVTGSYSSVKALDWDDADTAWTFRYDQNWDNGTPPPGAGLRYFNGYSHGAQLIDVSTGDAAAAIAAGTADYDLSAYFSSYGSQRDYGTIDLTFLDGMGGTLGTDMITDGDSTQWSLEATTGTVPVGTATVRIDIYGTARSGAPDGYIENVDFRITSSAAGDIPEPASAVLFALGMAGVAAWRRRTAKARA